MPVSLKSYSNDEKKARLQLIRSRNIGPITFHQLIKKFGTARKTLKQLPRLARTRGSQKFKIASEAEIMQEARNLQNAGGIFLHIGEENYPPYLALIEDAPPVLSLIGHPHLLKREIIAIVGARNASTNAKALARRFSSELAQKDFVIISGLARGIDAAAHRAALTTGSIAVVAGGIDIIYPQENADLYKKLAKTGAILSEMPFSTVPQARHFPRRNRLISGCSLGVLIIEAALKSGSLITANFAADQGREVFAVPGPPQDGRSRGCNALIKSGATLCETPADILTQLKNLHTEYVQEDREDPIDGGYFEIPSEAEISQYRKAVQDAIGHSPVSIEAVLQDIAIPADILWTIITELELTGDIQRITGNKIVRITQSFPE